MPLCARETPSSSRKGQTVQVFFSLHGKNREAEGKHFPVNSCWNSQRVKQWLFCVDFCWFC